VGQHRSASASRLLGLDGFEVLAAQVAAGEWQLEVQTTATVVGCRGCGVRAELHGRRTVRVRDLPIGGRPVVLAWRKRIWRCREEACGVRTWTERAAGVRPRAVPTERARAEACRRVGKDAHAVAAVARDLGVGWATIMRAVADHGTPNSDHLHHPPCRPPHAPPRHHQPMNQTLRHFAEALGPRLDQGQRQQARPAGC
jgi:transposase